MKFSCIKEHLERALDIAERFAGKNITLPILGNVLLSTKGNSLSVSATNLEFAVEVFIPGRGTQDDSLSVPAKVVSSFIRSFQEEKVDLEGKQMNLFIKTDTRNTRINGVSPEDFPLIPKIKKTNTFSVDGGALSRELNKVLTSVSPSEFKPELAGVFFKVSSNEVKLAATDTFRLSEATLSLSEKKKGNDFSFILPYRTSQEIARVLYGEEVEVATGENQIEFTTPTLRVVSRLIEGNFPDYVSIIPKKFETTSYIKQKALLNIVRGAVPFISKMQEVSLSFTQGTLVVVSANQEIGEYSTTISTPATGKEVTASFNCRYLLDGLSALDEEDIFIGLNGQDGPALLRNKADNKFLYALMPIRLI